MSTVADEVVRFTMGPQLMLSLAKERVPEGEATVHSVVLEIGERKYLLQIDLEEKQIRK